jgi:hypothetical protein
MCLASSSGKNNQQQSTSTSQHLAATEQGQKRISSLPPPLYRSRTDSDITYTPPSIGEAPGKVIDAKYSIGNLRAVMEAELSCLLTYSELA